VPAATAKRSNADDVAARDEKDDSFESF